MRFLKELEIPGADICWYCKENISGARHDQLMIDGAVIPMHTTCIDLYNEKLTDVHEVL